MSCDYSIKDTWMFVNKEIKNYEKVLSTIDMHFNKYNEGFTWGRYRDLIRVKILSEAILKQLESYGCYIPMDRDEQERRLKGIIDKAAILINQYSNYKYPKK